MRTNQWPAVESKLKHTRKTANADGVPQQSVTRQIAEFTQNGSSADLSIFRNFEGDEPEQRGAHLHVKFASGTSHRRDASS